MRGVGAGSAGRQEAVEPALDEGFERRIHAAGVRGDGIECAVEDARVGLRKLGEDEAALLVDDQLSIDIVIITAVIKVSAAGRRRGEDVVVGVYRVSQDAKDESVAADRVHEVGRLEGLDGRLHELKLVGGIDKVGPGADVEADGRPALVAAFRERLAHGSDHDPDGNLELGGNGSEFADRRRETTVGIGAWGVQFDAISTGGLSHEGTAAAKDGDFKRKFSRHDF